MEDIKTKRNKKSDKSKKTKQVNGPYSTRSARIKLKESYKVNEDIPKTNDKK